MQFFKSLLVATTLFVGPFMATGTHAADQMDNGLWVDVFSYDNGSTGRVAIIFHADNDNGRLAVCGTYYLFGGAGWHQRLLRAVRRYRVSYQGQVIANGVGYMARVRTEAELGSSFTCLTTNLPYVENANDLLQGRILGVN